MTVNGMHDNPNLPFGLRPYDPGEFERVHAAGSGILTASQIPALFGHSRFGGRYAIAAHISGRVPMESADNPMTARGRRLEPIAAEMLAEDGYSIVRPKMGLYANHPAFDGRFVASPDAVAWALEKDAPGIVEIKVVSELVYRDRWSDGPPLEVELQHQAQFAACEGAEWGVIAALVIGAFRLDLIAYPTQRNEGAVKLIEGAARALLDILAAGEMPEPDTHESAAKVLQALHPIDPSREITLTGSDLEEASRRFNDWQRAAAERLAAEKIEKDSKAWFLAMAKDASRILIGNDCRVEIKDVTRAGFTVKPSTYRQVKMIQQSEAA
jgi:hypothetical protein